MSELVSEPNPSSEEHTVEFMPPTETSRITANTEGLRPASPDELSTDKDLMLDDASDEEFQSKLKLKGELDGMMIEFDHAGGLNVITDDKVVLMAKMIKIQSEIISIQEKELLRYKALNHLTYEEVISSPSTPPLPTAAPSEENHIDDVVKKHEIAHANNLNLRIRYSRLLDFMQQIVGSDEAEVSTTNNQDESAPALTKSSDAAAPHKTSNPKLLKLLGDKTLAKDKALRILGDGDEKEEEQMRHISTFFAPEISMSVQKLYSAPDPRTITSKAMKIMGEKMLAPTKVKRVLGDDDDEKARKLALQQSSEVEIDLDMMKRISLERVASGKKPTNKKADKAVNLLGEVMIAGSKAEKVLGDQLMTREQQELMWKSDQKEKEELAKYIAKNGPALSNNVKEFVHLIKEVEQLHPSGAVQPSSLSPTAAGIRRSGVYVNNSAGSPKHEARVILEEKGGETKDLPLPKP